MPSFIAATCHLSSVLGPLTSLARRSLGEGGCFLSFSNGQLTTANGHFLTCLCHDSIKTLLQVGVISELVT